MAAEIRFLVDEMLGKLAKWLRILGYDTLYYLSIPDDELLNIAAQEQRLILTRDTRLIQRKLAKNYLLILHDNWLKQLKQLQTELGLDIRGSLLTRCCRCNQVLKPVESENVKAFVPEYVYQSQSSFRQCPLCQRIYWPATHVVNILKQLERIA
jgi:uncharacterized protein with PIN domain